MRAQGVKSAGIAERAYTLLELSPSACRKRIRACEESRLRPPRIPMLRCQKIRNHNPVRIAIAVLKDENDLRMAYMATVRKTDFRTKAHGLAGQLLCEHLQTGLDKSGSLRSRTVWTIGKGKLSDFSVVVERYCERLEII